MMERNAPFGVMAGAPNFAQGGTNNRFAREDAIIRLSRAELFGEPMMEVLPSYAPFAWAWTSPDGSIEPQDAIAAGAGESMARNLWGGMYYGYHPYAEQGYPEWMDSASYTPVALGYSTPLYDPDQDFFHYAVPEDAMPQVKQRDPWAAGFMRALSRGRRTHPARVQAEWIDHGHELITFEGHSE